MKPKHFFYFFTFLAIPFLSSCDKEKIPKPIKKEILSGFVQKGPFVNGSSITIVELNSDLGQTGKTFHSSIIDNSGAFEQKNIELVSQFIELKVDGFYFDETTGQNSTQPLTLYTITDIETVNAANVNVLTHLEKSRVEYLVKQGKTFAAAKQQAQREVLAIFGFEPIEATSESLNLTQNAQLLAISCILQSTLSVSELIELMANIKADMRTDGKLDNISLGTKLMNNAYAAKIALTTIRQNLENKYAELGITVTIPDFESYIISFADSDLYPTTISINYPATGLYGDNILFDGITELKRGSMYSMRAEVPTGLNLKVMLTYGDFAYALGTPINWSFGYPSQNAWTLWVSESGKPSDIEITISNGFVIEIGGRYAYIEYYENGATTPTKVKKVKIVD